MGARRTATSFATNSLYGYSVASEYVESNAGTTKELQGLVLSVIQWDGKGNYTQNADVTVAGKTGSGTVTDTYTIVSNGRFSRI
jgi:hypothetical protein